MFVPVFQCPQKLVRTFSSIYRKHIVYTALETGPNCHSYCIYPWKPLLRIRIRRIGMLLDLPDPDPEPLVRGSDPDPDPSIKQK
jgi:hypothetical protein